MKVYISKLLLSIFCLLPLFKGELLLPLYAEESWNEKLFDRDNRESKENKKTSTKEYSLLFIEASVAKKEQRYDDLLNINKDNVQLSVNSANSGEGNEKIKAEFNAEYLNISFNS